MKNLIILSNLYLFSLLMSCAEAPVYEPKPKDTTITSSGNQNNAATGKTDQVANNTQTPAAADKPADAVVKPTPTPTPTPAPAAPTTFGVAATGKAFLMQTCVNANCHSAAANTIDAKTDVALKAAPTTIAAHQAQAAFFALPANAENNFTHVLAYLKSIATPVMGPALP